jgi:putative Ca2+/H+ antiporter (TMEM165/GDT1 family)
MSPYTFATVFISVFLAEIGDKTQLATMLFAAKNKDETLTVFLGSTVALVAAAGIAVAIGSQMHRFIAPANLKILAGVAFVAIGIWTIFSARG